MGSDALPAGRVGSSLEAACREVFLVVERGERASDERGQQERERAGDDEVLASA